MLHKMLWIIGLLCILFFLMLRQALSLRVTKERGVTSLPSQLGLSVAHNIQFELLYTKSGGESKIHSVELIMYAFLAKMSAHFIASLYACDISRSQWEKINDLILDISSYSGCEVPQSPNSRWMLSKLSVYSFIYFISLSLHSFNPAWIACNSASSGEAWPHCFWKSSTQSPSSLLIRPAHVAWPFMVDEPSTSNLTTPLGSNVQLQSALFCNWKILCLYFPFAASSIRRCRHRLIICWAGWFSYSKHLQQRSF